MLENAIRILYLNMISDYKRNIRLYIKQNFSEYTGGQKVEGTDWCYAQQQ